MFALWRRNLLQVAGSALTFGCMAAAAWPALAQVGAASSSQSGSILDQIPAFAELQKRLEPVDEIAVLEALHIGLTDAADGATYVWQRKAGLLAGSVQPTASFRDRDGRVCRHIVFQVQLGPHIRRAEGLACRQPDRSWVLSG